MNKKLNQMDFNLDFFKNKYNLKISDNLVKKYFFVNSLQRNFIINFFQENLNNIDIHVLREEYIKVKKENDILNNFDNYNFNTSKDKFLLTKKIEELEFQNKKYQEKLENGEQVLLEKEKSFKTIIKNKVTQEKEKYKQLENKFNKIFLELDKVNNQYSNFKDEVEKKEILRKFYIQMN